MPIIAPVYFACAAFPPPLPPPFPCAAPAVVDAELPAAVVTVVPACALLPWPPVLMVRPDPVVITVDCFVDAAVVALDVVVVPPVGVVDVGLAVVDVGGV